MNTIVINNWIKGIAQIMVVVVEIQYCMYLFSSDLKQQATDARSAVYSQRNYYIHFKLYTRVLILRV